VEGGFQVHNGQEVNTTPEVGDRVIYVDTRGKEHHALITAVWPKEYSGFGKDETSSMNFTGLNLVHVSDDEKEQDPFGRQIKREASVCHESVQSAPGNYWKEA
jgi:hypothetical protein